MTPNYQFYGVNGVHLNASLSQLRTSEAFNQLEAQIAARYDSVVVVVMDNSTTVSSYPQNIKTPEETDPYDKTD